MPGLGAAADPQPLLPAPVQRDDPAGMNSHYVSSPWKPRGSSEEPLNLFLLILSLLSPMVRGQKDLGMWGWGQAQAVPLGAGMGVACPCQPLGTLLPAALLGFSSLCVSSPPVRHMVLKLA